MSFCRECGKEVQDDWITCPFCSQDIGPPASNTIGLQDSVVMGDVSINDGKECPDCKSTNVKVMICKESACSREFCELCDSHCRWEYPDQLFMYNSGMGAGPYC